MSGGTLIGVMLEQIRLYLSRQPFQEFVLNIADGRKLAVKSTDYIWLTPKGGLFYWHQHDDTMERVNPLLVVGVRGAGDPRE